MARATITEALSFRLRELPGEYASKILELGQITLLVTASCAVVPAMWVYEKLKGE